MLTAWFEFGIVLNAVERLPILGVALPQKGERHSGPGHQITLVGRVDEHFRADDITVRE